MANLPRRVEEVIAELLTEALQRPLVSLQRQTHRASFNATLTLTPLSASLSGFLNPHLLQERRVAGDVVDDDFVLRCRLVDDDVGGFPSLLFGLTFKAVITKKKNNIRRVI